MQDSLKFGILVKTVAEDADDGSPVKASLIEERGASELTARDAMVAADNRHLKKAENTLDKCVAWLRSLFDGGEAKGVLREAIIAAAEKAEFNKRTVDRAATELGVEKDQARAASSLELAYTGSCFGVLAREDNQAY